MWGGKRKNKVGGREKLMRSTMEFLWEKVGREERKI